MGSSHWHDCMDAWYMALSPGEGVVYPAMYGHVRIRVLSGVNSGKTPLQGSNPLKRTCAPWTSVCAAGAITTVGTWRYEAVYSGLHVHKWPLRSTVQANSSCVSARGRSVHQGGSCCCSSSLFFPPGLHSTEPGLRLSFLVE